jgi:hypothetical protein
MLIGRSYTTIDFQMKPALVINNFFVRAVLAALCLSSAASAGTVFLDNNVTIGAYTAPNSGAAYTAPAYTIATGLDSAGPPSTVAVGGMAYDAKTGEILVANYGGATYTSGSPVAANGDILEYTLSGAVSNFNLATQANNAIVNPEGIATDAAGNVYVGASAGTALDEFSSSGTYVSTLAASGLDIQSLVVNAAGDVLAAESNQDLVEFAGGTETVLNVTLTGSNHLGMTFDGAGDLFITYTSGSSNGGIEEITAAQLSALYSAGTATPTAIYSTGGNGGNPLLASGIAYDYGSGDLELAYAASFTNQRGGGIQTISTGGTFIGTLATTMAGAPQGILDPVPEPGTFLLSGLGLLAISLFYLRRKNLSSAC